MYPEEIDIEETIYHLLEERRELGIPVNPNPFLWRGRTDEQEERLREIHNELIAIENKHPEFFI